MKPTIFCLGVHPAVQRTLIFDRVRVGEVNRALARHLSAAGKSINTAVALSRLGAPACAAAFNGGAGGRIVAATLRAQGVVNALIPIAGETRTCVTLCDRRTGKVTELVEAGPKIAAVERKAMVRSALRRAAACRMLIVSGTLPAGFPPSFYVPFAVAAQRAGHPVIIDSHGAPLRAVLPYGPLLAKLNVRELEATCNCRCGSERGLLRAARSLLDEGAHWVLVTRGAMPAWLLGPDACVWRMTPPEITAVNPIGSGDCVTAGVAHAWLGGVEMPDAVALGIACGTANALTPVPAAFSPAAARRLRRSIVMERVG